ncbi:hypothetical protein G6L37_07005 [Agrobacterium rubi]|nr:hypothetical protein [Agrobacterium rubi]NTF25114.1 hypothetical protein [Agrobacterium rubi]
MNRTIQAGDMPYVDLSEVEFPQDYVIPQSGTIAASYQKGFEISDEISALWRAGQGSAIAAEFVMSYYRSKGFENGIDIEFLRDDPDCIGGFLVTARDKGGFEYMTYAVWEVSGKIYIDQA